MSKLEVELKLQIILNQYINGMLIFTCSAQFFCL